jgi:hypothetical protein
VSLGTLSCYSAGASCDGLDTILCPESSDGGGHESDTYAQEIEAMAASMKALLAFLVDDKALSILQEFVVDGEESALLELWHASEEHRKLRSPDALSQHAKMVIDRYLAPGQVLWQRLATFSSPQVLHDAHSADPLFFNAAQREVLFLLLPCFSRYMDS